MKKLLTLFRSRLTLRLWVTLVVPILGISLCILLAAGLFFDGYLMDQSLADAQVQTEDAADSFSRSFRELRERMVRKISSADFRAKVLAAALADEEGYTQANNDLQQDLSEFAQMSGMARGALLVGTGRLGGAPQVFYSYEDSRRDQAWAMLDFDLSGVSGITLLPAAPLPGEDGDEVLTLVVPLYFNTTSLLLVRGDPAEADAVLYVFLDAAAVTEYLNLYCEDAYRGTLYLANEAGEPLSLTADAAAWADAADPTAEPLKKQLSQTIEARQDWLPYGDLTVYVEPISSWDGLYLVNLLPREQLLTWRDTIYQLLLLISVSAVAAVTLACGVISSLTTHPLRTLMQTVHRIEENRYDGALAFPGRADEIGQLDRALCGMEQTIQQQMQDIRRTEQEKFAARMQLLTEQINPHFLYNTLEFINMEVLTGRPENASHMIASLGEYCRISLAYGDNEHTIRRELDQVQAYADIMSCRFSHDVELLTNVPKSLQEKLLPKCTLQPLVENSLRHGFGLSDGGVPFPPKIEIVFALQGEDMVITVTDNGQGIDIPRAEKILREGRGKNEDRHIGLHNIYERLRAFYGRAEFRFSSVPYFENTVEIRLPARFFADPDPADPDPPAAKTRTFVQYSKQPPIDKPPPGRLQ